MTTWIKDDNGNKCSVEYFGSKEAAQKALDSLRYCNNCIDCSGCSGCSGCSRCSDCSGCSDCSRCSDCSDCSDCSGCSGCSRCSRCSDCSGCSRCSRCSDCSDCSDCSGCSDCSDCSDCSGCSDCSDCSNVAFLYDKKNAKGDPDAPAANGPPPVPVIENIHQVVYAAASNPGSLEMNTWHTCENTHCRAGWVVTLAGAAGKALEQFFDTPLAAMKILDASSSLPKVSPVRFYESNTDALADMEAMAEAEARLPSA